LLKGKRLRSVVPSRSMPPAQISPRPNRPAAPGNKGVRPPLRRRGTGAARGCTLGGCAGQHQSDPVAESVGGGRAGRPARAPRRQCTKLRPGRLRERERSPCVAMSTGVVRNGRPAPRGTACSAAWLSGYHRRGRPTTTARDAGEMASTDRIRAKVCLISRSSVLIQTVKARPNDPLYPFMFRVRSQR
jgi:hypothetical protein